MGVSEERREARAAFLDDLARWDPPDRHPLSAEPYLAASCVEWGLAHGRSGLALRAAATLTAFAPDLLWRALLTVVAEELEAGHQLINETLAALELRRDQSKRGNAWKMASLLIDRISWARRSPSAKHLALICGDQWVEPREDLREAVETGRRLLAGSRERLGAMEKIAEGGVSWALLDAAEALWRRSGRAAALMLPLSVSLPQAASPTSADVRTAFVRDIPLAAMTHQTPQGLAALRQLCGSDDEIRVWATKLGLDDRRAAEAIGEIFKRSDRATATLPMCGALERLATPALVPHLNPAAAKEALSMCQNKRAAIDGFRQKHLSSTSERNYRHT